MKWLLSLLNLDYVTVLISPFGFRNSSFSFHQSFKSHVLQFVSLPDVPQVISPEEAAPRVWVWVWVGLFMEPGAELVA